MTTIPSIPRSTQKLTNKFNTPQILRSGWYTIWGIGLLLLIISIYGVNSQRQAIKTVGKDAAPSILTAQQLQDSFADMDASLANELLLKPEENCRSIGGCGAEYYVSRRRKNHSKFATK
jgi:hypothetical protein